MPNHHEPADDLIVDPQGDADRMPVDAPPATDGGDPETAAEPEAAAMTPFQTTVATIAAAIALVLLFVFYFFMIRNVDTDELFWARRMEILTGVEAIVFAAAGFLFGSQVQRSAQGAQTAAAKEKAAEAKRQARREELKAERERSAAAAAAEKQKQAEIEGKQLAMSVLTAEEAAQPSAGARGRKSEYDDLGADEEGAPAAIRRDRFTSMHELARQIVER